jgi:protein kinase A
LTYKFNDLIPISILGSGTFGRVSLVREKNTQNIYALKAMLKTEIVAHKQQNNVLNEKNIMMSCNHPFILRMYQTFKDVRKLYMLLEFVQGGELFAVLHTSRSDGVSDAQAKFYAVGIILALGYLHKKDIAYRDLKPENCLIDKDGYPKLIDFGFAKILTNGAKTYTLCGTPEYLAPELVLGRGHNRAVDYWAFGILIYEMQAGFSPFSDAQGMDQVVICRNIVNGKLQFPRNFNTDCKDLVKRLLVREIQNRLGNQRGGVEDVVKHPWFNKIDYGAYFERKLKAPWIPKVKSITDCSHFDPYGIEDHPSDGPIDNGTWDRNF